MLTGELRRKIEARFGHPIRYPKDCELLALHISELTNSSISASTIKRLFGLIKTANSPNAYTLDVISRYLGFANQTELNEELANTESVKQLQNTGISPDGKKSVKLLRGVLNRKYSQLGLTLLICLIIVVGSCFIYKIYFSQPETEWIQLAEMPEVRADGGIANHNDTIFFIGGIDALFLRNNNWMFDPKSKRWSERASMPTARGEFGCALIKDKIYCFGGWLGNNIGSTDAAEAYNIKTNKWEILPNIPHKITSVSAVSIGNQVYVLGGTTRETKNYFFRYNILTQKYDTLSVFKTSRNWCWMIYANGQIYVFGGIGFSHGRYFYCNNVDVYNPDTGLWTTRRKIPEKISKSGVVLKGNEIHLIGGTTLHADNPNEVKNIHFSYNILTDKWKQEPPLPFNIASHRVTLINQKIVIIGGIITFKTNGSNCSHSKKVYIEK